MPRQIKIAYLTPHLRGQFNLVVHRPLWQRVGLRLAHPAVISAVFGLVVGSIVAAACAVMLNAACADIACRLW